MTGERPGCNALFDPPDRSVCELSSVGVPLGGVTMAS